ncbi:MAG: YhdH/YhfP family quinone oxidoreductase [Lentisphaeraceae bacterium]|nr:YhdH/YhfP family quinone oxidoreductase [Lentisphaeraceae bacterium]
MNSVFKALVVEEGKGSFTRQVQEKAVSDLPDGDLLIKVSYSSLNYKDALSASGNKGVTRNFPHTPGIDAAGVVVTSSSTEFSEGDEVIVTSYDLGMNTAGGFGQYIRVPKEWVLKLPQGLSLKESMILGTAGLTAGMSVQKIHQVLQSGKIAVSGATGGVGSLSIAILSKLGYEVVAISGKESEQDYLFSLGAQEFISREKFSAASSRPLLKGAFDGAIDTVGGAVLENLLKSVNSMGAVTICGNVASADLNTSVYPFILRGLSAFGIDSQNCYMSDRKFIWEQLASLWKPESAFEKYDEIGLDDLSKKIDLMLEGKVKGRTLVNLL